MNDYNYLLNNIGKVLEIGRKQAFYAVNTILVNTYWEIGRRIVEYEQKGKSRADYGTLLLDNLSKDLKLKYGKGFSRSNLVYIRKFYKKYPELQILYDEPDRKGQTVSDQLDNNQRFQAIFEKSEKNKNRQTWFVLLTWSHYIELLDLEEDLERKFYENQCIIEKWSVRELKRQIDSGLFYRIIRDKAKDEILKLAHQGQILEKPKDLIKDPYILEFLNLPENYSEKEFEQKIIENLQKFLLELGKGFTFVSRQFRITLGNNHYYIDLVFYNRILNCFVLIDLKIGKTTYGDIGQMNTYLNYFKKEENSKGDNEPIGIILSAKKDDIEVEYALGGISNKLFVSKYKLYLPDREELKQLLERFKFK